MDSWATIRLPSNHEAIIHFLNFDIPFGDCDRHFVELVVGEKAASNTVKKYCEGLPSVNIFDKDVHVHFVSGTMNKNCKGFRLQFTFRSWILKKVSDDLWNCSVPTFKEDYEIAFPCNGQLNCLHGEDEENCPYTNTSECKTGQWWLAGRCYEYVDEPVRTWTMASAECRKRGGALVSLNTPEEWDTVDSMLAFRAAGDVYIGLKSFGPNVPLM